MRRGGWCEFSARGRFPASNEPPHTRLIGVERRVLLLACPHGLECALERTFWTLSRQSLLCLALCPSADVSVVSLRGFLRARARRRGRAPVLSPWVVLRFEAGRSSRASARGSAQSPLGVCPDMPQWIEDIELHLVRLATELRDRQSSGCGGVPLGARSAQRALGLSDHDAIIAAERGPRSARCTSRQAASQK